MWRFWCWSIAFEQRAGSSGYSKTQNKSVRQMTWMSQYSRPIESIWIDRWNDPLYQGAAGRRVFGKSSSGLENAPKMRFNLILYCESAYLELLRSAVHDPVPSVCSNAAREVPAAWLSARRVNQRDLRGMEANFFWPSGDPRCLIAGTSKVQQELKEEVLNLGPEGAKFFLPEQACSSFPAPATCGSSK